MAGAWPPKLLLLMILGGLSGAAAQCSSVECTAGMCVDATPGAAELGVMGNCPQAVAVAALDCTASMDTLDASLSSSVSLGAVCARTCGWCANPMEFQDIWSLARPFCTAHQPPTCVAAPGSGATGCQPDDGSFSAAHPTVGKADCETVAGCVYTPGQNQPPAADCVVHPFSLTVGEMAWMIEFDSAPVAAVLRTQGLDGEAAASVTKEELLNAGLTLSEAAMFTNGRDALFKQVMPGLREHAMTVEMSGEGYTLVGPEIAPVLTPPATDASSWLTAASGLPLSAPTGIEATAIIESIFSVSEMDYTFEAEFRLMLSWNDLSIFRACEGVKPWPSPEEPLQCPEIWRPALKFVNGVDVEVDEENSEFYASPYGWDIAMGGDGTEPAVAFMLVNCKGTFTAPMSFRDFPSDIQSLPIQLYLTHLPDPTPRSMLKISPYAALSPQIVEQQANPAAGDTLSGWDVTSATAQEGPFLNFDTKSLSDAARNNGGKDGAFVDYMDALTELNVDMDMYNTQSMAQFNIVIERKASYFVLNYVLIVSLLTAVSWLTFYMDPTDLASRSGVALTLLLAIGVFQLILNDIMPQTGYLTPMHIYILVSTFYVVMVVVESLVVHQLKLREASEDAVISKLKESMQAHGNRGSSSMLPSSSLGLPPLSPGSTPELRVAAQNAAAAPSDKSEQVQLRQPEAGPSRQVAEVSGSHEQIVHEKKRISCRRKVTEHLDTFSLIFFPISYAIFAIWIFV